MATYHFWRGFTGRLFDQLLIACILLSVLCVMLDSVAAVHRQYGLYLYWLEWLFTLLFTVEYLMRLYVSERPARYARSFLGWSISCPSCRPTSAW